MKPWQEAEEKLMNGARRLSAQAPSSEVKSDDGRQWICMFGTKHGVLRIDLNDGDNIKKSITDWLKKNDLDAKLQVEGSMSEDSIGIESVKLVE